LLDAASLLQWLGLGCLMHDVGKLQIPHSVLNKPGRLMPAETAVMQLHPILGYEMVEGRIPPAAADIVLHHHQRYDGRGYPEWNPRGEIRRVGPLAGEEISIVCRIAAVCDVYDAATARGSHSPAKAPVQALYEMRTHYCDYFDPVVLGALRAIVPPFPIGQPVTLSNTCEAVVVDFNASEPERPKVQVIFDPAGDDRQGGEVIDLAESSDVRIVAADGCNVCAFLDAPGPERRARETHQAFA
jgi:HD-GYP domain-containing protein (c-di-GMP phosphodiesterase class II)